MCKGPQLLPGTLHMSIQTAVESIWEPEVFMSSPQAWPLSFLFQSKLTRHVQTEVSQCGRLSVNSLHPWAAFQEGLAETLSKELLSHSLSPGWIQRGRVPSNLGQALGLPPFPQAPRSQLLLGGD